MPFPRPLYLRLRTHRHFHTTPTPRILETTLTATHTLLTTLHTTTTLPWYALIPLSAVLLRATITTPTTIYSRSRSHKTLSLQPLITAWQHPLSRQSKKTTTSPQAWESNTRTLIRQKRTEILRRHKCQRWKSFAAPILQLPVWIAASVTLRGMSGGGGGLPQWWWGKDVAETILPIEPSLAYEGTLWFQDLLDADPMMVLPMVFSFLMFANIEMQSRAHPPTTRGQRILIGNLRIIPLVALPFIINMPAALTLYWATSAGYSLVQNLVLEKVMPRPKEIRPCKSTDPYKIPVVSGKGL